MSDVDFKDVSVRHWRCFGQQWNSQFVWEKYGDKCVIIGIKFGQMCNYRYRDHNVELDGDLGTIKMKILVFQMKNGPEVYLEWENKVDWIFQCHNYLKPKKVKLVVICMPLCGGINQ